MIKVKTVVRHKESFTLVMDDGTMVSVAENEIMHGPPEGFNKYVFHFNPVVEIDGKREKLDLTLGVDFKSMKEIIERFPKLYEDARRVGIQNYKEKETKKKSETRNKIWKPGRKH